MGASAMSEHMFAYIPETAYAKNSGEAPIDLEFLMIPV
jgi:hypothetical protein